jgi:hypothetical protein
MMWEREVLLIGTALREQFLEELQIHHSCWWSVDRDGIITHWIIDQPSGLPNKTFRLTVQVDLDSPVAQTDEFVGDIEWRGEQPVIQHRMLGPLRDINVMFAVATHLAQRARRLQNRS